MPKIMLDPVESIRNASGVGNTLVDLLGHDYIRLSILERHILSHGYARNQSAISSNFLPDFVYNLHDLTQKDQDYRIVLREKFEVALTIGEAFFLKSIKAFVGESLRGGVAGVSLQSAESIKKLQVLRLKEMLAESKNFLRLHKISVFHYGPVAAGDQQNRHLINHIILTTPDLDLEPQIAKMFINNLGKAGIFKFTFINLEVLARFCNTFNTIKESNTRITAHKLNPVQAGEMFRNFYFASLLMLSTCIANPITQPDQSELDLGISTRLAIEELAMDTQFFGILMCTLLKLHEDILYDRGPEALPLPPQPEQDPAYGCAS